MKTLLLCIGIATGARADLSSGEVERLVDRIKVIENSRAHPYGIKSVRVAGEAEARRVCRRTVLNTYRRWEAAGRPGRFTDYLGDVYCPPASDLSGNKNWKRNMRRMCGGQN